MSRLAGRREGGGLEGKDEADTSVTGGCGSGGEGEGEGARVSLLTHSARSRCCCSFHQLFDFTGVTRPLECQHAAGWRCGAVGKQRIRFSPLTRCRVRLCVGLSSVLDWRRSAAVCWWRCSLAVADLILVEGTLGRGSALIGRSLSQRGFNPAPPRPAPTSCTALGSSDSAPNDS